MRAILGVLNYAASPPQRRARWRRQLDISEKGVKEIRLPLPRQSYEQGLPVLLPAGVHTAWLSGKLNPPPSAPTKKKDIDRWRRARYQQAWVVYAKGPFDGPDQVVEYLGRYTHKAAISNHRLLDVGPEKVSFHYKDYREKGVRKTMALDGIEFLRRFCLHILPPGFRRMRHYGILSNYHKASALTAARASLGVYPENVSEKKLRAERIRDLLERHLVECSG